MLVTFCPHTGLLGAPFVPSTMSLSLQPICYSLRPRRGRSPEIRSRKQYLTTALYKISLIARRAWEMSHRFLFRQQWHSHKRTRPGTSPRSVSRAVEWQARKQLRARIVIAKRDRRLKLLTAEVQTHQPVTWQLISSNCYSWKPLQNGFALVTNKITRCLESLVRRVLPSNFVK